MLGNKNKSKTAKTPLAELQNLQSELRSLRQKHITALNKELLLLEKEEVSQKSIIDKIRDQLTLAKLRPKEQQSIKPSIKKRTQASVDTHQARFDNYQAELAQLRSRIFEKKLESRKEEAVLKAIIDTETTLVRPEKPKPVPKKQPDATPAEKPTLNTAAARTKKPSSASPPSSPKKPPAPRSDTKPSANGAASSSAVITAAPSKVTTQTPGMVEKEDRAPRRRVRRWSDIPTHPDKPGDRLASLFDDF